MQKSTVLRKVLIVLFFLISSNLFSQENIWTWVAGSSISNWNVNPGAEYGTLGVENALNHPGPRMNGISWTGVNNDMYIFGGEGYDVNGNIGYLNDLWRFNFTNNQWTWISGDNTRNNYGDYGTLGVSSQTNKPGSRVASASWVTSNGDLYLFGGSGYAASGAGRLNDLWKYDISSNNWTWISGSNIGNQNGEYGTQGIANINNIPDSKYYCTSWLSNDEDLYLFGGHGTDYANFNGYYNDLWKYNITTGLWTWVSGSKEVNQPGIYGTKGVADVNNVPGARFYSVSWKRYK